MVCHSKILRHKHKELIEFDFAEGHEWPRKSRGGDRHWISLWGSTKCEHRRRKLDALTRAWYNNYPNSPRWIQGGEIIASGVGTAGSNIRWGKLTSTGRADYLAVEPFTGAVAAFPNGCDIKIKPGEPGSPHDELRMKPDHTTSLLT
jgi:hypothetical protein